MPRPEALVPRTVLPAIARSVLDDVAFFNEPDCPFKGHLQPGRGEVLVITGENASGKSLVFTFIAAMAKQEHGLWPATISIRERAGCGPAGMAGMRRSMMFGDEDLQSTGATSVGVVERGFANVDRDGGAILMLDEPELGLSEGYSAAMGAYIGRTVRESLAPRCAGVVVVTHSHRLVRSLQEELHASPSFLHMGERPLTLEEWLIEPEVRTIEDLLALQKLGNERRRKTNQLFKQIQQGD